MLHVALTVVFWVSYVVLTVYCVLSTLLGYVLWVAMHMNYHGEEVEATFAEHAMLLLSACSLPALTVVGRLFGSYFPDEDTLIYVSIGVFLAAWLVWLVMTGTLCYSTISGVFTWLFHK